MKGSAVMPTHIFPIMHHVDPEIITTTTADINQQDIMNTVSISNELSKIPIFTNSLKRLHKHQACKHKERALKTI